MEYPTEWAVMAGVVLYDGQGGTMVCFTIEGLEGDEYPPADAFASVVAFSYNDERKSWHIFYRDPPARLSVWGNERDKWQWATNPSDPYEEECMCGKSEQEVQDYIVERLRQAYHDSHAEDILDKAGLIEEEE